MSVTTAGHHGTVIAADEWGVVHRPDDDRYYSFGCFAETSARRDVHDLRPGVGIGLPPVAGKPAPA